MRDYAFFFGIMRIMRSEPNYAISHPRIIPEALFLRVRDGWSQWQVKIQRRKLAMIVCSLQQTMKEQFKL